MQDKKGMKEIRLQQRVKKIRGKKKKSDQDNEQQAAKKHHSTKHKSWSKSSKKQTVKKYDSIAAGTVPETGSDGSGPQDVGLSEDQRSPALGNLYIESTKTDKVSTDAKDIILKKHAGKRKFNSHDHAKEVCESVKKKRASKEKRDAMEGFQRKTVICSEKINGQKDNQFAGSRSGKKLQPAIEQQESLDATKAPSKRKGLNCTVQETDETESGRQMPKQRKSHLVGKAGIHTVAPKPSRTSKLLAKFHDRLLSGHFRYLNEKLYTGTGAENYNMMHNDKSLFEQYHRDYNQQMKGWPILPLDVAVSWLRKKPNAWKVADFGCGEARLEKSVPQNVSSLDLVALVPGVIECNMANTPLETESHDCAVFCLALMGVDYQCYLKEAYRVLKHGGMLWIAEVCSRFVAENGKEEYQAFNSAMNQLGFQSVQQSWPSKFFVVSTYTKGYPKSSTAPSWPTLKACAYKKR